MVLHKECSHECGGKAPTSLYQSTLGTYSGIPPDAPIRHIMKLYSFYTPTHEVFVQEWFLPTLQDEYTVILEQCEQSCPSGDFMAAGWLDTMLRKVDLILRGIDENWGDVFVHSDVDVQFFAPTQSLIEEAIANQDLVVQRDAPWGELCAGFFACRANDAVRRLWSEIRSQIAAGANENDQVLLNNLLRGSDAHRDVRWSYLPDRIFSGGTLTGRLWCPGEPLRVPENIVIHHANWTVGVENKLSQLRYVRELVTGNKTVPGRDTKV